jgi:uncharacterized iron-regulated membrane protein
LPPSHKTESLASATRTYRRLHKFVAVPLFIFMFIIGLTGILLGWKKQAKLTPPTQKGASADARQWLPMDSIQTIALAFANNSLGFRDEIDRLDVRPGKGIVKVVFVNDYTEIQIDLTTGQILSTQQRWNDFIEQIHDGTIVDRLVGTDGDPIKTTYTTLTSMGLMLLSFSGFWLWFNPKRIRKIKHIE